MECGYRHIDTAFVYDNEEIVGKVLKDWMTNGKVKREDLFITTKLPMMGLERGKTEYYLKKSLEALQLDYVDLYLIHCPWGQKYDETCKKHVWDNDSDFIATWAEMEKQIDSKRIKYIGLSNFNMNQIGRVLKSCRIRPANLQVELHVYLQQNELIDYCKNNDITVVAYGPLGNPAFQDNMKKYKIEVP